MNYPNRLTSDGVVQGENIITLKEYRYPIRLWQTELPGGLIDPGETAEQAAVREL
ncbi:NUDIX domain-containing protein [Blautia stercoris]